ncbi:ParB/RepB/Spo0J family partition protein [Rhizosaccharibacter radicis]|uniref:ParB/RepB/Spo0J family partition protein n=1 Tax=Rhizosaccharibacter radicis TaxID=2782605 RepID=A0ABT1VST5_9PROT|nr:ParB/RepB/Spo0J family partition protein [Acetobacteraceae bacterium KSS12]
MSRKKDSGPRLGRGLAALLGETAPSFVRQTAPRDGESGNPPAGPALRALPIEWLEPGPFQPRQAIEPGALEELAASIRTRGLLQPILARPHPNGGDRHQIIGGERRWRAAQMAGLHEVPVHVLPLDDADAMAAALVENLQRQDLNALEEAEGMQRLLSEYGLTQEELAGAVGKSRSHVANTVRLLQVPDAVRQALAANQISAGHARALLGHPQPAIGLQAVLAGRLNVRQTEEMVRRHAALTADAKATPRPRDAKDPEIASLEKELRESLGLKVEVQFGGKGGSLRIQYDTLDQLDDVLRLLKR